LLKVVTIKFFQTLISITKGLSFVQSAGGPGGNVRYSKDMGKR